MPQHLKYLSILILAFLFVTACGGTASQPQASPGNETAGDNQPEPGNTEPVFLNMGATNSASSQYAYAVALAQSIEQGTGGRIKLNVVETGASLDNARRMRRGEISFGLVTQEAAYQIYHGTGSWESEGAWKDIRTLFVYVPTPYIIVVRTDSGVERLQDLDGKPFSPGIQGSSGESSTRRMLEALGVQPEWRPGAIDEAVNDIKDGAIVGFGKAAAGPLSPDATYLDVSTFVDVRVIGIDPQDLPRIKEKMPDLIPVEVPAGVYPEQDEPLLFPGGIAAYSTYKDFDEQLAYDIVKAAIEHKALQEEAMPAVKDLDYAELTMTYSQAPLHLGAYRYYVENGIEVPEHLIPPEAQ